MRRFTGVLIACAAGLVLVGTAIAGFNANKSVHLTGELEVPANASAGQGSASFHLSEDGLSVDYKLKTLEKKLAGLEMKGGKVVQKFFITQKN